MCLDGTTCARVEESEEDRVGKTASKTRPPERPDEATVTASSGNAFADLGLRNADALAAKADLAHAIQQLIQAQAFVAACRCSSPRRRARRSVKPVPGKA